MTTEEFTEKYGAAFAAFTRTSCYKAFRDVLDKSSPTKQIRKKADGERFNGAPMFLGEIKGYEDIIAKIDEMAEQKGMPVQEQVADYMGSEVPTV